MMAKKEELLLSKTLKKNNNNNNETVVGIGSDDRMHGSSMGKHQYYNIAYDKSKYFKL